MKLFEVELKDLDRAKNGVTKAIPRMIKSQHFTIVDILDSHLTKSKTRFSEGKMFINSINKK